MKKMFAQIVLGFMVALVFYACTKTADTPAVINTTPLTIAGTTTGYYDTITATLGNVVVQYSHTSPCYPSNEIFTFSVATSGFPSDAIYLWNFGDGDSAKGTTVQHLYLKQYKGNVLLYIKDNSNQVLKIASFYIKAWGQNVTPRSAFRANVYNIDKLNNVFFTSESATAKQGGLINNEYKWDFKDGGTYDYGEAVQRFFPELNYDKVYPVALTVRAESGCTDVSTVNVSVPATFKLPCAFTAQSQDVCTNEKFVFTSITPSVPGGSIYQWDFSDATGLSSGQSVTHAFTYQNTYDVKMYITYKGKNVCDTSAHKSVFAYGQNIKPKALFHKNVQWENQDTVSMAYYSSSIIYHGAIIANDWYLANKNSVGKNDTYLTSAYPKLSTPTNYNIMYVVTGNSGCTDTATTVITIPAK